SEWRVELAKRGRVERVLYTGWDRADVCARREVAAAQASLSRRGAGTAHQTRVPGSERPCASRRGGSTPLAKKTAGTVSDEGSICICTRYVRNTPRGDRAVDQHWS